MEGSGAFLEAFGGHSRVLWWTNRFSLIFDRFWDGFWNLKSEQNCSGLQDKLERSPVLIISTF